MRPEDVTLAIPCHNAERTLPRVLSAVDDLSPGPTEVICIEGGSTDQTLDILHQYDWIRVIRHERRRGTGAARQTALKNTSTPGLAMIDADIVPQSDWLGVLCQCIEEHDTAAVGAEVIEHTDTRADRWRAAHLQINEYDEPGYTRDGIANANALFRVDALEDVGGWDCQFTFAHEDVDLFKRLYESGYQAYYTTETNVRHYGPNQTRDVLEQVWRWHFEGINEPSGFRDLPIRSLVHGFKAGKYAFEDIRNGNWDLLPITLLLPVVHLQKDVVTLTEDSDLDHNYLDNASN